MSKGNPNHIQIANLYSTTGKIFLDVTLSSADKARLLDECLKARDVLFGPRKDPALEYVAKLRALTTLTLPAGEGAPKEPSVPKAKPDEAQKKTPEPILTGKVIPAKTASADGHVSPAAEAINAALDSIVADYIAECDEEQVLEIIQAPSASPRPLSPMPASQTLLAPKIGRTYPPEVPAERRSSYDPDLDVLIMNRFYTDLEEAFERLGKSTSRLASYFGMSQLTVVRWLSRDEKPAPKRIEQMASILERVRALRAPTVAEVSLKS